MPTRKYKPTSSARRFMTVSTFEEVTCTTPERSLLESLDRSAGRNFQGKITVRHRGGQARRNTASSISGAKGRRAREGRHDRV